MAEHTKIKLEMYSNILCRFVIIGRLSLYFVRWLLRFPVKAHNKQYQLTWKFTNQIQEIDEKLIKWLRELFFWSIYFYYAFMMLGYLNLFYIRPLGGF